MTQTRQVVLSFLLSASNPLFSHHANWRNERGVIRWGVNRQLVFWSDVDYMLLYGTSQTRGGPRMRRRSGGRGLTLMMRPFDCKCAFHLWHRTVMQRADSSLQQTWRDLHYINDICVYPYFIVETSNLLPRGGRCETSLISASLITRKCQVSILMRTEA